MKTPEQAAADVARKLATSWQHWLSAPSVGATDAQGPQDIGAELVELADQPRPAWPLVLPLGRPSGSALKASFGQYNQVALVWRDTAARDGLELRWENRTVSGSTHAFPTHLLLPDLDAATAFTGAPWPVKIGLARRRQARLGQLFGAACTPAVLRESLELAETDFQMLCTASAWLAANDVTGMTARQVPIEGVHGKWLNARRRMLLALSGRTELDFVERPSQVRFTYLDPTHIRTGQRRHDSHTLGDTSAPLYRAQVAVISENKDTAQNFLPVPAGISVQGGGFAACAQLPQIPWLRAVPHLLYWGDLDAEGFEILDALRAAGLPVRSLLMDSATFQRYEPYGSWTGATGQPLAPRAARALPHLTATERALYQRLVDPDCTRVRRIEQERIPLAHALQALRASVPTASEYVTVASLSERV